MFLPLPRGIGLVHVTVSGKPVTAVSHDLTRREEYAARIIEQAMVRGGKLNFLIRTDVIDRMASEAASQVVRAHHETQVG